MNKITFKGYKQMEKGLEKFLNTYVEYIKKRKHRSMNVKILVRRAFPGYPRAAVVGPRARCWEPRMKKKPRSLSAVLWVIQRSIGSNVMSIPEEYWCHLVLESLPPG